MKRRQFISNSLKGAVVPFFMSGSGMARAAQATFLPAGICAYEDRVLVVIHLNGANDTINSTVPLSQYGAYQSIRPNIAIEQSKLLTLDSQLPDDQQIGLHPGLQGFKDLYEDGHLAIVQRAGYPIPNRSHFSSEAIWLKGVDGSGAINTEEEGWIGRFLKDRYPTYQGLPFGNQPDPLGIMLGNGSDTGFHSNEDHDFHINLSGQDPAGFYNIISSISGEPIDFIPPTDQGELLQYMAAIEKSTQIYSGRISSVFNAGTNSSNASYLNNSLGSQLKTIVRFLSGGSTTKVFFGRTGGWDTHVREVDQNDTSMGSHRLLLEELAANLKAFQADLEALGLANRVTTVLFSEFGRKIIQNGSYGTDHGTLSSLFVLGHQVQGGVYGKNIDLSVIDAQGAPDAIQLEHDYRGVFGSILRDWMGSDSQNLHQAFPNTDPEVLLGGPQLITTDQAVNPNCYFSPVPPSDMNIRVKLFLEGLYDNNIGTMKTNLVDEGILPLQQPFGNDLFGYYQPDQLEAFPDGVVDWLLLELRTKDNFVTVGRQACLIKADGWVVNLDGNHKITFSGLYPDHYHLAVFHHSHLGILSSETTDDDASETTTFTINQPGKVLGELQLKQKGNEWVLINGDLDQNGNINVADYETVELQRGTKQYAPGDLNRDGFVRRHEKSLVKKNLTRMGYPGLFPKLKS